LLVDLAPAISVQAAIDDLPQLKQGEDGSHLAYRSEPQTPYQSLMRGALATPEYLKALVSTTQSSGEKHGSFRE
jgi:DNA (cytosine-5)-methyltransferase 1